MRAFAVTFLPDNITLQVEENTSLLQAQIAAGLRPDAPCGGKGTCGKCRVTVDGREVLACQTLVDRDLTVLTETEEEENILTTGLAVSTVPEGRYPYVLAFDIGTTTVVAYLLDGHTGELLAQSSCRNPQGQFGADVISRIQYAQQGNQGQMADCIRDAMKVLASVYRFPRVCVSLL